MKRKTKRKSPSKPQSGRKAPGTPKPPRASSPATAKDKEELIRIWDEDLCE